MSHRFRLPFFIAASVFIAFLVHGFPESSKKKASTADEVTLAQWAQDLDFLVTELPKKHKNLFHNISETEFQTQIKELKTQLPSMALDEILVGLMRIIASVGDSHTTLGYRPQQALPLMLYWFKDGIAILNTTAEYKGILYGKITAIGGKPIEDIIDSLATIIPHENEAQVKNMIPNLLTDTLILHGMKLIPSQNTASLTVLTTSGTTVTLDMKPLSFSSKPEWLVDTSDESDAPLYLKNRRLFYWYEILPDSQTLFFKYNSCKNIKGEPFSDFVKTLFDTADAEKVRRIVIDLRHNGGGNSGIFAPFLEELKKRPKFLKKGSLYVLIGRRTFSSAILNAIDLKKQTPAIFLGEPTGGKPNHYGEVQTFRLPQSGLPVTYSVKYFRVIDDDPDSLMPDILIEPRISEYLKKLDPVLNFVLGKRNPF
ncbi:MAG: peptidase S41 [Candidatus Aminicenantes bacterium]|nr:peptidase S41 [Candidatus Aminicenantes bacterium]